MIEVEIEPIHKPKYNYANWYQAQQKPTEVNPTALTHYTASNDSNVVLNEKDPKLFGQFIERDQVIKKALKECMFKEGDEVMPHTAEARKKYGVKFRIDKIVQSYVQYTRLREKWPTDNNPKIIHAYNAEKDETIYCTPNFLVFYDDKIATAT